MIKGDIPEPFWKAGIHTHGKGVKARSAELRRGRVGGKGGVGGGVGGPGDGGQYMAERRRGTPTATYWSAAGAV